MLEHHLELLECQNRELERELEGFVTSDEAIKQRLKSKTPPKKQTLQSPLTFNNGYRGSYEERAIMPINNQLIASYQGNQSEVNHRRSPLRQTFQPT